jgi:hypothetical protein
MNEHQRRTTPMAIARQIEVHRNREPVVGVHVMDRNVDARAAENRARFVAHRGNRARGHFDAEHLDRSLRLRHGNREAPAVALEREQLDPAPWRGDVGDRGKCHRVENAHLAEGAGVETHRNPIARGRHREAA